ncbi:hypothetical protein ACFYU8_18005 [Brevibacillus sp. NPDC003359]|uniref:hypothetical protein n=1 Tax=unclassified Brevibacillus TaxID=2684853 RepID=UPI0036B63761
MPTFEQLKKYKDDLQQIGISQSEILEKLARVATQQNIADLFNVNVRRVKYLFKKYGIKKYNRYQTTRRCTHCKENLHVSWFPKRLNGDKVLVSSVCDSCQKDYYRTLYMRRVLNNERKGR